MANMRPTNAIRPVGRAFVAVALLAAVLVSGPVTPPASAQVVGSVIFVDGSPTGIGNNGTSWANAYNDLNTALASAVPGNQIWVAAGTYQPDATDQTASFEIPAEVEVYGGFQGTENAIDQRDPSQFFAVLTGEINSGVDSDNSENIVAFDNADNARLDGFIITGGNADGATPDGAGIRITDSVGAVIANTRVTNSVANGNGGGVYVASSSVAIISSQIDLNDADGVGGALYAFNALGGVVLTNVLVFGNQSSGSALEFDASSDAFLTNTTVVDNSSGGVNGANGGSASVVNSIVRNNTGGQLSGASGAAFSNVSGGASGTGNIDVDPLLTADYALGFSSLSVDAGDSAAVPPDFFDIDDDGDVSEPTPDLRRNDRIDETAVDQGAIESLSCPTTIHVDQSNAAGTQDGAAWASAFADLQDGLALAHACADNFPALRFVHVAAGTYTPTTSPTDQTASFNPPPSTRLLGGFPAGGSTSADPDANLTVLSGDIIGNDGTITDIDHPNRADNSFRVVVAVGNSIRIEGFRIQGGNADGKEPEERVGGGVYASADSSFRMVDVEIRRNAARDGGGGVAVSMSTASPELFARIVDSEILLNESPLGAGVIVLDGSLRVTNSEVTLNFADDGAGGGFAVLEDSLELRNVLVRGNEASVGGGIALDDGTFATVLLSTVADNEARERGGAVAGLDGQPGGFEMSNSILWGNDANSDPVFSNADNRDVVYSTVQGGEPGTGNLSSDPLFASSINLRPVDGSPSIDAGAASLIPRDADDVDDDGNFTEPHSLDLDSTNRFVGFAVDHGAYESATGGSCGASTVVFVDRTNSGFADGDTWGTAFADLQIALLKADSCPGINEVRIAEGTYRPSGPNPSLSERNRPFSVRGGLLVTGGYPAGGASTSDPLAHETVLSGDLNDNDDGLLGINNLTRNDNSYLVVDLLDLGSDPSTLKNLTIADGHDNRGFGATPSGVLMYSGQLTGVRLVRNVARSKGSAADIRNPQDVTIVDSVISENGDEPSVAIRTGSFVGGGPAEPSEVAIINTSIIDNENGPFFIEARNNAGLRPLDVQIVNSLIADNGDAIRVDGFADTTIGIVSSTLAYNSFNSTSPMFDGPGTNVDIDVTNSIVWNDGNTAVSPFSTGITATASNSSVAGGSIPGSVDIDPEFVDPANGNYRLAGSSDLINAGSNALLPADVADLDDDGNTSEDIPVDLDGSARVRNGSVDMGAFEAIADDLTILAEPCPVYDSTSANAGLSGAFDGNELRTIDVAGSLSGQGASSSCIPSGASLALVTITAVNPQASGNLRLSAAGVAPTGGVVNFANNGLSNSNTVAVPLSADGAVDIFANGGPSGADMPSTDVRLTVLAYADETGEQQFTPITPCAVHDSRPNIGGSGDWLGPFVADRGPAPIDVIGSFPSQQGGNNTTCNIPEDATGLVANVVVVSPAGTGSLSISPAGNEQKEPLVNFTDLTPTMNNAATVIVPLEGEDSVLITMDGDDNAVGHTRLVILGYTTKGEGDRLVPVDACAAFDTRSGSDAVVDHAGPRLGAQATTYQISGSVPSTQGGANGGTCGVPDGATSVLINLVAVSPTGSGNLQAYATGTTPTGGVLNFAGLTPAMNNSNAVIVPLSASGELTVNVNGGNAGAGIPLTQIRGVVLGYFG